MSVQVDQFISGTAGDNSELVASIPVAVASPPKVVLMSVALPDVAVGDILQVFCDVQVTNDKTYNALFSTSLIAGASAADVAGTEIAEAAGTNVTPDMHHLQTTRVGTLKVTNATRRFINLVGYSAASQAKPGDVLTVDADYGRLSVIRTRVTALA